MPTATQTRPAEASLVTDLPEKIKTVGDVNDVARVMIQLEREAAKVDEEEAVQQAKKVIADAQARRQEIAERLQTIKCKFDPQIEKFAKKQLAPTGGKTYETALVEVQFIWCPDIVVEITNKAIAVPYIQKECPTGVVMKPEPYKTGFTMAFKESLAQMKESALLKLGLRIKSMPHDEVKIKLKHDDILEKSPEPACT